MTIITRDSFDFANALTDLALNFWDTVDTVNGTSLTTTTRFGVGRALQLATANGTGVLLSKTFGSNESTVYCAGAFFYPTGFVGTTEIDTFRFYDGTTVQCSFTIKSNGDILFYRGDKGTLLGTFSSAWSATAWTHFQFKVVVDPTVGEFRVRKNGNTSDDFAITGLNTRSSANSYANKWDCNKAANAGTNVIIDDFAIWSGSGSGVWSTWTGDMRAVQVMPNADTSDKSFTPAASTIAFGINTQSGTRTLTANNQYAIQQIAVTLPGTISKVTLPFNASATGHIVMGIYDSSGVGGEPGSLISNGTSNVITNPTSGNNDFTFTTPPSVQANASYWIVVLADVNVVLKTGAGSFSLWAEVRAYTSGLDSPMGNTANTAALVGVQLVLTPAGNFAYVQELIEDGTVSYIADSTPGDFDLYANPGLLTAPSSILGVSVRGFLGKSDAGARTGTLRIKSGSTSVDGSTQTLSTTMQNFVLFQDSDPATSAAWDATGIANLKFGPKVVA